ncbi:MAG: cold-shock protein [Endozoicomonas sp.]
MKLIHTLVGLITLALFITEITEVSNLSLVPADWSTPALLVLLTTATGNTLLGTLISNARDSRKIAQFLTSVLMLAGSALAIGSLFNGSTLLVGFPTEQLATITVISATLLHFATNARHAVLHTPQITDDSDRETGTVKWFNVTKGFGFITRDQGDDVFVHYRAIRGEGHRTLSEGQRVEFIVIDKDKGLQAEDVIAAARGR